jgi:hypothetical protein
MAWLREPQEELVILTGYEAGVDPKTGLNVMVGIKPEISGHLPVATELLQLLWKCQSRNFTNMIADYHRVNISHRPVVQLCLQRFKISSYSSNCTATILP